MVWALLLFSLPSHLPLSSLSSFLFFPAERAIDGPLSQGWDILTLCFISKGQCGGTEYMPCSASSGPCQPQLLHHWGTSLTSPDWTWLHFLLRGHIASVCKPYDSTTTSNLYIKAFAFFPIFDIPEKVKQINLRNLVYFIIHLSETRLPLCQVMCCISKCCNQRCIFIKVLNTI